MINDHQKNRPVIYLDETCVNAHGTKLPWLDSQYHSHVQIQKNTGDYHDEITNHFEKLFATKYLPNIPPNSFIVMDNASYHSRCSAYPPSITPTV